MTPELTPEERRKRDLEWLSEEGLLMKSRDYFSPAGRGFPVKVCEGCGAIIDATLWQKHEQRCRGDVLVNG